MIIKHLIIENENRSNNEIQTYMVKNTINNKFVRLGKDETAYLLSSLGEIALTEELQAIEIKDIPSETKEILDSKFEEWGFLDDTIRAVKRNSFEKLKKIHLVEFNVQKVIAVVYPIYSKFFSKWSMAMLIGMVLSIVTYFTYAILSYAPTKGSGIAVNLHFTGWSLVFILAFLFINTLLHEFAHAITCVKYGGSVKKMGILLFYFIPCFYCDVTDVYSIQDRKKRAVVAASGLLTNLFIGSVMLIVSIVMIYFGRVNVLLFYMAISTISVSIYNLIPFVKLDGYWLLSALSGMDNMMDKSVILAYTSVFSRKKLLSLNMKSSKRIMISLYGLISFVFHPVFWLYTFYMIYNRFVFKGVLVNTIAVVGVVVIAFDLVNTFRHYHQLLKNDHDRILQLCN